MKLHIYRQNDFVEGYFMVAHEPDNQNETVRVRDIRVYRTIEEVVVVVAKIAQERVDAAHQCDIFFAPHNGDAQLTVLDISPHRDCGVRLGVHEKRSLTEKEQDEFRSLLRGALQIPR